MKKLDTSDLKYFLYQNKSDTRATVIFLIIGAAVQHLCKKHIERSAKSTDNKIAIEEKYTPITLKLHSMRGSALIEVSGFSLKIIVNFLAKKGLATGLLAAILVATPKIPLNSVANYVYNSLP